MTMAANSDTARSFISADSGSISRVFLDPSSVAVSQLIV